MGKWSPAKRLLLAEALLLACLAFWCRQLVKLSEQVEHQSRVMEEYMRFCLQSPLEEGIQYALDTGQMMLNNMQSVILLAAIYGFIIGLHCFGIYIQAKNFQTSQKLAKTTEKSGATKS